MRVRRSPSSKLAGSEPFSPRGDRIGVRRFYKSSAVFVVLLLCVISARRFHFAPPPPTSSTNLGLRTTKKGSDFSSFIGPCAITLYGLPRSFKDLVLPSLIKNVLETNAAHHCDYFVHFFILEQEPPGRDGRGGKIDASEILLLQEAIERVAKRSGSTYTPVIHFRNDTDQTFREARGKILEKIYTARNNNGNWRFVPTNHPSYTNTTIENVVKMWHGQTSVFDLMESSSSNKHYSRVAMLRCDVVYVTPIDVYQLNNKKEQYDWENEFAVIPSFAKHPVNDRLMVGPYDAVKVWAAKRFDLLDVHGDFVAKYHPGDGIHSERYLEYTIFPLIRDGGGVQIVEDSTMCFLRARADRSIRMDDCGAAHITSHNQQVIEDLLGRPCHLNKTESGLAHLECAAAGDSKPSQHLAWE